MERLNVYNIRDMYDDMGNPAMLHIGNNGLLMILRKNVDNKKSIRHKFTYFCEIVLEENFSIINSINKGLPLVNPIKEVPNHTFFVRRYKKVIDYIFEIKETCNAETK